VATGVAIYTELLLVRSLRAVLASVLAASVHRPVDQAQRGVGVVGRAHYTPNCQAKMSPLPALSRRRLTVGTTRCNSNHCPVPPHGGLAAICRRASIRGPWSIALWL